MTGRELELIKLENKTSSVTRTLRWEQNVLKRTGFAPSKVQEGTYIAHSHVGASKSHLKFTNHILTFKRAVDRSGPLDVLVAECPFCHRTFVQDSPYPGNRDSASLAVELLLNDILFSIPADPREVPEVRLQVSLNGNYYRIAFDNFYFQTTRDRRHFLRMILNDSFTQICNKMDEEVSKDA